MLMMFTVIGLVELLALILGPIIYIVVCEIQQEVKAQQEVGTREENLRQEALEQERSQNELAQRFGYSNLEWQARSMVDSLYGYSKCSYNEREARVKEVMKRLSGQKTPIKEEPPQPREMTREERKEEADKNAKDWIREHADLVTEFAAPVIDPGRTIEIEAKYFKGMDQATKDRLVTLMLEIYHKYLSFCEFEKSTGKLVAILL